MNTLNVNDLHFEEKNLHVPTLQDVREVISNALPSNFKEISVEIIDCPNLTSSPFHLAGSGLGGSPSLIEIGGAPYLLPLVQLNKLYNLSDILKKSIGKSSANILGIGAGAGPYPLRNVNCEGIFNVNIKPDGTFTSESFTSRVDGTEEKCVLEQIPNNELRVALLANIFACEGTAGPVLRVHCKQRIGSKNFIESIRTALANHYGDKCVGLGGVFLLKNGNAKQHVMRSFSKTPINTEEELNTWLKFYDMPSTLVAVGTLVTNEFDLDLRLQHFHSFHSSKANWGGHYHIDTTPDIVEYEGYFNIAEKIVRVDRPLETHKFGRD